MFRNTFAKYHIQITKQRASEILKVHPEPSLETLKMLYNTELYTQLLKTSSYYIIQTSGQKTPEYLSLKTKLKTENFRMLKPSSSVLAEIVPSYLKAMCVGPLSLVYTFGDAKPKYVVDLCAESGGKMCLLGGMVDKSTLSKDGICEIMNLPSIDVLRSELIGVLGRRGQEIIGILGRKQEDLVLVLDRRIFEEKTIDN